jgi:uncharacterized protein
LKSEDFVQMSSEESTHSLGIISDTHGLLRSAVVRAFEAVEMIIHAGDIGRLEVLKALREIAPVIAVRGNTDGGEWARSLPTQEIVTIGKVVIYVTHDLHEIDLNPAAAGFRVVVSGHSHMPSVVENNGVMFLNPGSAGPRRFKLPISLAVLKITQEKLDVKLIELES